MSATPPPGEQLDFSLVQGGPLFQLLVRTRLLRPPTDFLARRIAVVVLVAWMPLLVLTVLSGQAFGGSRVPFLSDLGAHARLLVAVPLLLAAEVIVHRRIIGTVRQFLDRGIVVPEERAEFDGIVASAMRLRNSVPAELLLLAVAIFGAYSLGARYISLETPTWYTAASGDRMTLTAAGTWYFFVGLTSLRFLLLRWYFRLFVWYRFLWQVARRLRLRLNPLHPDGAGGLGFLSNSVFAFEPILLAQTIGLSGIVAGKILFEGATLPEFKLEIVAWMAFLMALVLLPLTFFVFHLSEAKRTGLREYGLVGSRYVAEFRRKWIEGGSSKDEALVGTADIQSLADLSNSYQVVKDMNLVPFGRATIVRLVMMTALPLAPLSLTMVPLEELVDRALAVFF